MDDWRQAELPEQDRAICAYVEKLTLRPGQVGEEDVQALREAGLGDEQILNVASCCAYFNFINRMADGLGVDLEPEMPAR